MTKIEQIIRDSEVQQVNQSVTIRVGERGSRRDETLTGLTVTNMIAVRNAVYGRCLINDEVIALRLTGENTWRVND